MSTRFEDKRNFLVAIILMAVMLCLPSIGFADDLDDVSIQVIGLDEIPDSALERIPMPAPNFGGLTDIRHNIISNQISADRGSPIGDGEISTTAPVTDIDAGNQSPK